MTTPKYMFSIGAVFKNESHALDEWIQHYLQRGVNHIYLINDFSTDTFRHIIEKYAEYVTLFDNDIVTDVFGRQGMIYDKYLKPILCDTTFIGIFDLDEFLYSPNNIPFNTVLSKYNKYSQIIVKWLNFGSNHCIEQPTSIIEGFTKRCTLENNIIINAWSFKTIVQSAYLKSFIVHKHNCNGDTIDLGVNSEELLINHYINQSLRFYMDVKCTRGSATNFQNCPNKTAVQKFTKNRERFDVIDSLCNDVTDTRLVEQNKLQV
jgi:hypothetical protein